MFALFDKKLESEVKERMAAALLQMRRPARFRPGKPAFPVLTQNRQLHELLGSRSWLLFDLLHCEGDWLYLPPDQWVENPEYIYMSSIVTNIAVVNDAAERGIKDIQEYTNAAQDGSCGRGLSWSPTHID